MHKISFGRREYISRRTCRDVVVNKWRVIWVHDGHKVLLSDEWPSQGMASLSGAEYVEKHGGNFEVRQQ